MRDRWPALALAIAGLVSVTPIAAATCPAVPPPVRDLAPPRYYTDTIGSEVDADLQRRHAEAVAPLKAFLGDVTSMTDRAIRQKDLADTACALAWITIWAEGEAWLGRMGSQQAEYQRKWDLAGAALTYLKLRPHATAAQHAIISPWLVRIAEQARAFQLAPGRKRNNHRYWLGLALAATALATDTPGFWDDARQIVADALADIRADGTLPLELERGQRALHYHAFAVTPLVVLADLAARRGEDWYALSGGALHRLVERTASGLVRPDAFGALAGAAQERPVRAGAGWLWLYERRFPGRLRQPLPEVPRRHRWLGGDVALLPLAPL